MNPLIRQKTTKYIFVEPAYRENPREHVITRLIQIGILKRKFDSGELIGDVCKEAVIGIWDGIRGSFEFYTSSSKSTSAKYEETGRIIGNIAVFIALNAGSVKKLSEIDASQIKRAFDTSIKEFKNIERLLSVEKIAERYQKFIGKVNATKLAGLGQKKADNVVKILDDMDISETNPLSDSTFAKISDELDAGVSVKIASTNAIRNEAIEDLFTSNKDVWDEKEVDKIRAIIDNKDISKESMEKLLEVGKKYKEENGKPLSKSQVDELLDDGFAGKEADEVLKGIKTSYEC